MSRKDVLGTCYLKEGERERKKKQGIFASNHTRIEFNWFLNLLCSIMGFISLKMDNLRTRCFIHAQRLGFFNEWDYIVHFL